MGKSCIALNVILGLSNWPMVTQIVPSSAP